MLYILLLIQPQNHSHMRLFFFISLIAFLLLSIKNKFNFIQFEVLANPNNKDSLTIPSLYTPYFIITTFLIIFTTIFLVLNDKKVKL
jgi:hypothetical protein